MIPAAAGHPPRAQITQLGAHHGCQDQTAAADQIGGYRAHGGVAVRNRCSGRFICGHGCPPGGCGRQAETAASGMDYLAAPAIYAATM